SGDNSPPSFGAAASLVACCARASIAQVVPVIAAAAPITAWRIRKVRRSTSSGRSASAGIGLLLRSSLMESIVASLGLHRRQVWERRADRALTVVKASKRDGEAAWAYRWSDEGPAYVEEGQGQEQGQRPAGPQDLREGTAQAAGRAMPPAGVGEGERRARHHRVRGTWCSRQGR